MSAKCKICGKKVPDDIAVCADCVRQSEIGRMMMERRTGWQKAVLAENLRQLRSPDGVTFILWVVVGLPVAYWLATDALAAWFQGWIPAGKGDLPRWMPGFLLSAFGSYLVLALLVRIFMKIGGNGP